VSISVKSVQVEHSVQMGEFTKWLERTEGAPAEILGRRRIREILGNAARANREPTIPRMFHQPSAALAFRFTSRDLKAAWPSCGERK
jgi:hypothetical protein